MLTTVGLDQQSQWKPCQSPIETKNGSFPCKICQKKAQLRDLRKRLLFEGMTSEKVFFVTLTFRGKREITYQDVQLWLKRVRRRADRKGYKFKFYAVAERGSASDRLHYHLLTFGPDRMTIRDFRKFWRKGISHCITVKRGERNKTTKYIQKTIEYVEKTPLKTKASQLLGDALLGILHDNEIVSAVRDHFHDARITGVRPHGAKFFRTLTKRQKLSQQPEPFSDCPPLSDTERQDWRDELRHAKKGLRWLERTSQPVS